MKTILYKHKFFWSQSGFCWSVVLSLIFFAASLLINYVAGNYATRVASNRVTDIILDNVPVINMDSVYIYGSISLGLFIGILLILEPKRIPFIVKSAAIFYLTRAVFLSLTHIGP